LRADTVTYRMPPEGYSTLTLSDELLAQIDSHAKAIGAESRSKAIESLLDGYSSQVQANVVDMDAQIVTRIAEQAATELAKEFPR